MGKHETRKKNKLLLKLLKQGSMFYNEFTDTYYCDIEKVHVKGDKIFLFLEKEYSE